MVSDIAQCDFCTLFIPSDKPRLQCLTCPNYDLCAQCALGSKSNGEHLLSHPTQTYSISGGQGVQPVVSDDLTLVYAVPVIPMMSAPSSSPSPSPPTPSSRRTSSIRSRRISQSPPPPRSVAPQPISPPSPPALPAPVSTKRSRRRTSSNWSTLFDSEMEVTEMGEMFFAAIFTHLDPSYSGYLTPEAYSGFLDDLGYELHENVWKNSLIQNSAFGQSKETMADKALRNAYDLFSIEHVLKERPASSKTRMYSLIGAKVTPAGGSSASKMPLLTLKGFIEISTVEILCDPSREWGNLQRALKRYKLTKFASMPRHVLPEDADPRMQQRVHIVSQFAKMRDEQLMVMDESNAIDLVDDRRFCYRSD
ncbi:hypothetical protein CPB85DRAFT_1566207 [Mucidula mucida]|nr:hypothetical protein CPB85DRAFT_1566207 [Mucidula mucida]